MLIKQPNLGGDNIWRLLEGKAGCAVTGVQDVAAPKILPPD
jgi:hypothetical protein